MKNSFNLFLTTVFFICVVSACGGDSANDSRANYLRIENSNLNDGHLDNFNGIKLLEAPVVTHNEDGSGTLTLKVGHGLWLNEFISHLEKDRVIPKIETFDIDNSNTLGSHNLFTSCSLVNMAIASSETNGSFASLEYSFKTNAVSDPVFLISKQFKNTTKSSVSYSRFLKINGVNGGGATPGFEGSFNVTSYILQLTKTSTSNPGLYLTIPGLDDFVTLQNLAEQKKLLKSIEFIQIDSATGKTKLQLTLLGDLIGLPSLSSDSNGENLSQLVFFMNLLTTLPLYDTNGIQTGESTSCYSPVFTTAVCKTN